MINPKLYLYGWHDYYKEFINASKTKKEYYNLLGSIPIMDIYHQWRKALRSDIKKVYKKAFHEHYLLYYQWSVDKEGKELPFKELWTYASNSKIPLWFMNRIDIDQDIKSDVAILYAEFFAYINTIVDFKEFKKRFSLR